MSERLALEARTEGTVLRVRVTPRSSRTRLLGVRDGALCLAVQAPPEKGKANQALLRFLAKRLGVSRTRLTLLSGETARVKRLLVADTTADAVRGGLGELP